MRYDRNASLGYMTNWAARLFLRAIERRLTGGSAGPMPVFFALHDGAAMTQTALAREASVEQPTMAKTLDRMERDGLIERMVDPDDRRRSLVRLTPLGRARADQAFDAAIEVNALAAGALTAAELPAYLDMVGRIAAALAQDGERESR